MCRADIGLQRSGVAEHRGNSVELDVLARRGRGGLDLGDAEGEQCGLPLPGIALLAEGAQFRRRGTPRPVHLAEGGERVDGGGSGEAIKEITLDRWAAQPLLLGLQFISQARPQRFKDSAAPALPEKTP